ncbi:MAG: hypothetical protein R2762_29115 [Bryobacteraceae bacterium]
MLQLSMRITAAALAIVQLATPAEPVVASPVAQAAAAAANSGYKIEILSAAAKPKRRKNKISSESVIRVTDSNDVPVAGISVMFSLTGLSGGSAAFANGALSTVLATNAAGIASTGAVTAGVSSSFSIAVAASVPGQAVLTATIPVNMAAVAAAGGAAAGAGGVAAGGAAAGGGAAGAAGISGAVVGAVVAAGAAAAVVAAKTLGGDDKPTPPRVRIGGPGEIGITR